MRSGKLPALASRSQAEQFAARHGGQVQDFAALERRLPAELQKLAPHRH